MQTPSKNNKKFNTLLSDIQKFKDELNSYIDYTKNQTLEECFELYISEGASDLNSTEILLAHQMGLIPEFDFESKLYYVNDDGFKILFDLGYFKEYEKIDKLLIIGPASPFLFKLIFNKIKGKFNDKDYNKIINELTENLNDPHFDLYYEKCNDFVNEEYEKFKKSIKVDGVKSISHNDILEYYLVTLYEPGLELDSDFTNTILVVNNKDPTSWNSLYHLRIWYEKNGGVPESHRKYITEFAKDFLYDDQFSNYESYDDDIEINNKSFDIFLSHYVRDISEWEELKCDTGNGGISLYGSVDTELKKILRIFIEPKKLKINK